MRCRRCTFAIPSQVGYCPYCGVQQGFVATFAGDKRLQIVAGVAGVSLVIIIVLFGIISSGSREEPALTATPFPTATPRPTYTPFPTQTHLPTYTPSPTATPSPTYTPFPPALTATPVPVYTPTPNPTYTPYPTYTPQPTVSSFLTFSDFQSSYERWTQDNFSDGCEISTCFRPGEVGNVLDGWSSIMGLSMYYPGSSGYQPHTVGSRLSFWIRFDGGQGDLVLREGSTETIITTTQGNWVFREYLIRGIRPNHFELEFTTWSDSKIKPAVFLRDMEIK